MSRKYTHAIHTHETMPKGETPQEIIKTTACVCMQLQDMLMT